MASADPDIGRIQREVGELHHVRVLVEDLEYFCDPDEGDEEHEDLSLELLRTKIKYIPPIAVQNSRSLLYACSNENVTLEIVQLLLEAHSPAVPARDVFGDTPLHYACRNDSIDPKIVHLLLDFWPESARQRNDEGYLPIHWLCENKLLNDAGSLEILNRLIGLNREALQVENIHGCLPIHIASRGKSWAFCKMLIDIHPESMRIANGDGGLPIHRACIDGTLETVKNLHALYPEGVNVPDTEGYYPIHYACRWNRGSDRAKIIAFLLAKDPSSAQRVASGNLPLHSACALHSACGSPIRSGLLDSAKILFDAYPDAIEIEDGEGNSPVDLAVANHNADLVQFLQAQRVYAVRARDEQIMTTRDGNGMLPLHRALADGACLGATKLLVRGNRAALQVPNVDGRLPLHIACEFGSAAVVQFLIEINDGIWNRCDSKSDFPLHCACRGGNYEVVNYLLAKQTVSASETNADDKLPIDLLFESRFGATGVEVDESQRLYCESIYRLLVAYPDTLTQTLR